eukprot:TCONS_00006961-protein
MVALKLSVYFILMVLSLHGVIGQNDCPIKKLEGLYGTLNGGEQFKCDMETYEITFERNTAFGKALEPLESAVVLEWRIFHVPANLPECAAGAVRVYKGCKNKVEIAEFCSGNMISELPHNIYAYTDCLTVELDRMNAKQKGSFIARWYQLTDKQAAPVPGCSGTIKEARGIAGTLKWPKTTTTDCEFQLESEATNGYVIHIMDIAEGGTTCESLDQRIKVKDADEFSKGKYLCSPKRVDTRYFKPNIEMKYIQGADLNWNKRGFVMGWVSFKDPYHEEPSSGVSGGVIAAAIIIPLVLLILVVFLVIFILKRRRGFVFHDQGPRFKPAATQPPSGDPEAVAYNPQNGTTTSIMKEKPYPTQQNAPTPSAPPFPSKTETPLNPNVQIIDPNQKETTSPQEVIDDQKPSGSGQKPHKKKRRKHKKESGNAEGGSEEKGADSGRKKKRRRRPKDKKPVETNDLTGEQSTDPKAKLVNNEDATPSPPPSPPPLVPKQETEIETDSNKPLLSE